MSWFKRHVHEWGRWRVTLMTLSDSEVIEPAKEARHCSTCQQIEFRLKPPAVASTDTEEERHG